MGPTDDGLGPWDPLGPAEAAERFEHVPFWWAIAGGWAIDLFLGAQTRPHDDLDVAVSRADAGLVFEALAARWDCYVAAGGQLTRWRGENLAASVNSLWCRGPHDQAWRFELVLTEIDDGDWVFRRNPRIRIAMDEAITPGSPSYLSPQVQLLFKARHRRPKDDADLAQVWPRLAPDRRRWLHDALRTAEAADHPWIAFTAAPAS